MILLWISSEFSSSRGFKNSFTSSSIDPEVFLIGASLFGDSNVTSIPSNDFCLRSLYRWAVSVPTTEAIVDEAVGDNLQEISRLFESPSEFLIIDPFLARVIYV